MAGWFRLYDEMLDDPKVQVLPAEDFRAYVNLLCLANRHDGFLPSTAQIGFALRIDEIAVRSLVDRLRIAGLIDTLKGGPNGSRIAPHGWAKRQYKSDSSTDRVKRFRERSKDVTGNAPRADTDTEQNRNTEQTSCSVSRASYAFFGRTIRLKPQDLERWRRAYSAIPDIEAELTAIDAWFEGQSADKRAKWFHSVSGMLNRTHQQALAARADADRQTGRSGSWQDDFAGPC